MISIIFSLIQFIPLTYFFILRRKRNNIEFDIRHGIRCYSCKEKVMMDSEIDLGVLDKKEMICKSCDRAEKLSQLTGDKKHRINKIKRFFLSKKSEKIAMFILFGGFGFALAGILLNIIFSISALSFGITNITNTIFWIFLIGKFKVLSIKKDPV